MSKRYAHFQNARTEIERGINLKKSYTSLKIMSFNDINIIQKY